MSDVHTVAVFCGAQAGHDPVFHAAATELGRTHGRAPACALCMAAAASA